MLQTLLFSNLVQQFIRFVGIGFLNTAVDFAVLNTLMFYFNVFTGVSVGAFSVVSFILGVTHSYFWNKYWAFGSSQAAADKLLKSLGQFVSAAIVGMLVIAAVVFGAAWQYDYPYYLFLIVALGLAEFAMWRLYRLRRITGESAVRTQFAVFVFVSVIGALINYGILRFGTVGISPQFGINQELWTNIIKAGATGIALIWNFAGYKVFVFKK